jgi:hypothetical protein
MEGTEAESPAPGWYPDPEAPGGQRYWDGSAWTDHRSPGTAVQVAPVAVAPHVPTNGKAIAAMVLGIVWMCGIGSILALVFGYGAKNEIDAAQGTQGGRGMAVAGIVLGWIGVGFLIMYVVIYAAFGSLLLLGGSSN